jgi:hypothetical protein
MPAPTQPHQHTLPQLNYNSNHVELARLIFDHPIALSQSKEGEIEVDWSGIPNSSYALVIRQQLIEIIEAIACSSGQQCGTSSLLVKQADDFYAPAMSFWIEHSSADGDCSQPLKEATAAMTEFMHRIIDTPKIITSTASSDASMLSASAQLIVERRAEIHLTKFGSKPVPLSFGLQTQYERTTCSGLHQNTPSTSNPVQQKIITGRIVTWHAKNKHAFVIQPSGSSSTASTVHYERESESSDWRSLRLGLDETFIFELITEASIFQGVEHFQLLASRRVNDLIDTA